MSSPWSGLSIDFLSEGEWAIGQGPRAPDRQLFRALVIAWCAEAAVTPRLLEVGCGSGIDVRALAEEGVLKRVDYAGYDFTPEFVAHLSEHFPDERFAVRDVLTMTDEGTADIVWSRHVLEHVADGELALRNLWRASDEIVLISWFMRPTWSEALVGCIEQAGFLHQTYSARRLIEVTQELGAHLYRFDFDHHSTLASVWMLSREQQSALVLEAHRFLGSRPFLHATLPVPPPSRRREQDALDVLGQTTASLAGLLAEAETAKGTVARAEARLYGDDPLRRYQRLVLWGFTESMDSMRHIFRHFDRTAQRLGMTTARVPDAFASLALLRPGDLVFAVDVEGRELRVIRDVDYVLHNFDASHQVWERLEGPHFLRLQTYTRDAERYGVPWGIARRFDRLARTLFQPWGTDLLADEFYPPIFNWESVEAAFVGAVWDDGGLGNVHAIRELDQGLAAHDLTLRLLTHVTDEENVAAVRESRVAPAFTGKWQVENDYLPCRVFKNVSYGALALTNVPKFRELFAGCRLQGETIAETLDEAIALSRDDYLELVAAQQEIVRRYTYRESLEAIGRALEEGK